MAIRIENVSQNKKEAPLLETIAILSSALSYSDLSSDSPLMEEEREGSEIVSNKSVNITTNRENFNEKRISPLNFWNSGYWFRLCQMLLLLERLIFINFFLFFL